MKLYIDYYQRGCVSGEPVSACGDRATIQVDARLNYSNVADIAEAEGIKRGYIGYTILRGDSLLKATQLGPYIPL